MSPLLLSLLLFQTPDATPQIQVTGRATIVAQPERAEVDFGVVTEAPVAQEAGRRNAEKLDAVLKALESALGPNAKFETVSYSLQPIYRYPEPRNEPVSAGYSATNVVRAKDLALDKVGLVIDVATSAGANSVQNVNFSLRDEGEVKSRALREAASDARKKADTLADALGLRVVRVLNVTEGEPDVVRPMPMYREMAIAQAAGQPTPIEPGTIEVRASVTLVVEIAQ